MRWLSMDEILNVLNNSENMYLKRTEQYAAADKRIGIMNAIGYEDVSEEFLEKVLALVNIDANIKEIKGLSGNKGLYKGIVKVVFDPRKELDKFNSGDVLVAPMTRPEYITLMKKAAAFVTDEGGITSHAAIISREIGIPCIIGTKIATQVLKDGDLVEVDADKGVVRILERAESKN